MREEEDLQVEVADPTGEEEEVADPTKRKKNATEKKKAPTSESRKQHMNTHHQRQRSSSPATGEHHHHNADTRRHRSLTRKKWIELGEKERSETAVDLLIEEGWGGCEMALGSFIFLREPAAATPSPTISAQNRQPSAARSRALEKQTGVAREPGGEGGFGPQSRAATWAKCANTRTCSPRAQSLAGPPSQMRP